MVSGGFFMRDLLFAINADSQEDAAVITANPVRTQSQAYRQ
jgi:hypothetical protein